MEVNTVTQILINILLGSFILFVIACVVLQAQTFINDMKREKRAEESEKRDIEYHEKRMREFQK